MRVSVLLTCYNHLRFLPTAFESIVGQSFGDFELIALDDGSTDGSRAWLAEQQDSRLTTVFHDSNLGTYGSLNAGLERASGEYVAILNDDDVWMPDKLEAQVRMLDDKSESVLSHTGGEFIDGEGNPMADPAPLGFPFPIGPSGDVLPQLIERNQFIISSVMFRREAVQAAGGFDSSFYGCGDWHMWLRLARAGEAAFCPGKLTQYRVHESNATHKRTRMLEDDRRIREWIATWAGAEIPTETQAHNWAALGVERKLLGDRVGAREAFKRSLQLAPGRWKSRLRLWSTYLP